MKLTVGKGMDEYLARLGNLSFTAPDAISKAVKVGGDIVTDQIRANLEVVPVTSEHDFGSAKRLRNGPREAEKQGLLDSLGIAPERNDNGYVNVKAGFDGYNNNPTKKYPRGQPNAMIARSVESGTSFMKKNPFVAPAVRQTREKAEMAMASTIDAEISKVMK